MTTEYLAYPLNFLTYNRLGTTVLKVFFDLSEKKLDKEKSSCACVTYFFTLNPSQLNLFPFNWGLIRADQ